MGCLGFHVHSAGPPLGHPHALLGSSRSHPIDWTCARPWFHVGSLGVALVHETSSEYLSRSGRELIEGEGRGCKRTSQCWKCGGRTLPTWVGHIQCVFVPKAQSSLSMCSAVDYYLTQCEGRAKADGSSNTPPHTILYFKPVESESSKCDTRSGGLKSVVPTFELGTSNLEPEI